MLELLRERVEAACLLRIRGVEDWICVCVCVSQSRPTLCDPRLLCPWDFPGKNTGVGHNSLLQGISLTQGLNLGLRPGRGLDNSLRYVEYS